MLPVRTDCTKDSKICRLCRLKTDSSLFLSDSELESSYYSSHTKNALSLEDTKGLTTAH